MGVSAAIMMGAATLSGSFASASAADAQGEFQKKMGDLNAELADRAGAEAIDRGNTAANRAIVKGRKAADEARVSAAASGVDPSAGSAADIAQENLNSGLVDSVTLRNNAYREAWGYKVEAINSQAKGNFAELAGKNEARNTLLTGGLSAAAEGAKGYGKYIEGKAGVSSKKTESSRLTSGSDPGWFYGTSPRQAQPVMSDRYSDWWRK
jgi:hypothetical protein